jgi:hypothetical protein
MPGRGARSPGSRQAGDAGPGQGPARRARELACLALVLHSCNAPTGADVGPRLCTRSGTRSCPLWKSCLTYASRRGAEQRARSRCKPVTCTYASGAEGTRTPDPLHAMEVRYQLRHSPVPIGSARITDRAVPPVIPSRHISPLRSRPASATSQRCARPIPSPGRCHAASTTTRWTARRCW